MKNSKITVITDFLGLGIAFAMLVLTILAMKYVSNSRQLFFKIYPNGHLPPIQDIQASRWRCKSGYEPIFNFTFPGTQGVGCSCLNIGIYPNVTCKEYSEITANDKTCVTIPALDKTILNVWRNSTLCIKRMSFMPTIMIVGVNETCPVSYSNCGYYDMHKDIMCISTSNLTDGVCPINSISIVNKNEIDENDIDLKQIPLDLNMVLVYSRKENAQSFIPVDFVVSENTPCIRYEKVSNISIQHPYYNDSNLNYGCHDQADNNNKIINSTYLDKRYEIVDTVRADNFLIMNDLGVLNSFPNYLNYTRNTSLSYNLYARSYVRSFTNCINDAELHELINHLLGATSYQWILLVVNMINIFILCIFNAYLGLLKIQNKMQNILITLFKNLYCYSFLIGNVYSCFYLFSISSAINKKETSIETNGCTDETTLFAYSDIYEVNFYLNNWVTYNTINLYLCIPYAIVTTLQFTRFILKTYWRIRNRKRNEQARVLLHLN